MSEIFASNITFKICRKSRHRNAQTYTGSQAEFFLGAIGAAVINILAEKKGIRLDSGGMEDYHSFKEKQYDKLAQTLRQHLNMEEIYGMLREASLE